MMEMEKRKHRRVERLRQQKYRKIKAERVGRSVRSRRSKKQVKLMTLAERREYENQKKTYTRKQLTGKKNRRLKGKDCDRKKGMVKQSMAEEDTVADEDDGITSEDAAEEMEGLQTLNATSRQFRHYYRRKLLERMPQNRAHRAEALQSIILSATPTSRKAYKICGIMVKKSAQTKRSLMPEFKVMDRDVGRKISANHALRIKRKYKTSSKMAKTLAVSKGRVQGY